MDHQQHQLMSFLTENIIRKLCFNFSSYQNKNKQTKTIWNLKTNRQAEIKKVNQVEVNEKQVKAREGYEIKNSRMKENQSAKLDKFQEALVVTSEST